MNALRWFAAFGIGIAIAGCDSRPDTSAPGSTATEVRQREASALAGHWTMVSLSTTEKSLEVTGASITFAGGKMVMKAPGGDTQTYLYQIDPLAKPKSIQMTDTKDTNAPPKFAIYELDGKTLRLCLGGQGKPPTAFGADGSRVFLLRRP